MKWLLVTTTDNPGDAFVRVGVQRLIEAVDGAPDFWLVDKETHAIGEPIPFDRAVWCGMPLLWSHAKTWCWSMGWWGEACRGWLTADPKRYLIVGAGSFARWPGDPGVYSPIGLRMAAKDLKSACWRLIARDEVAAQITGLPIEAMPCPAAFATRGIDPMLPGVKLCNLMPDGSHYRLYGEDQALAWDEQVREVADILLPTGFNFAAHDGREHDFAERLGWPRERIVTDSHDPHYLLSAYAGCSRYFGNRVHGAIAAAGAGAEVWSVGYDSRQEAVKLCGGRVTAPMDLDLNDLVEWTNTEAKPGTFDMAGEFEKQRQVFAEFAA